MDPAEELIGQTLQETYRLERLIGKGGMGAVFEASHARLSRRFAIKVLLGDSTFSQPEAKGRFQREAEVTSRLRHPNIVETIDFNTTADGVPYIVMELLEGEDLEARLKRINHLPCAKVSAIIAQAASALQVAHDQEIIHRDLKPSNIFLCRTEEDPEADAVKIVDFGLSKILGVPSALTRTHQVMGSAWYMSPEQVEGETAAIGPKTDQFALGAIAYEMLTGRPPFYSKSVPTVLSMVLSSDPPVMSSLGAEVPPTMERAVIRALSKAHRDRFETVAGLAQAMSGAATLDPADASLSRPFDATLPLPELPQRVQTDPNARTVVQGEAGPPPVVRVGSRGPELKPAPASASTSASDSAPAPPPKRRSAAILIAGGLAAVVAVWVGFYLLSDEPDLLVGVALDAGSPDLNGPPDGSPPPAPDKGVADAAPSSAADASPDTGRRLPRRPHSKKTPPKKDAASILLVSALHADAMVPAAIYLDGVKIGEAPLYARDLKPGNHVVEARYNGYNVVKRKITLVAGKKTRLVLPLTR
jgi:serine/threonine protein kinase